MGYPRVLPWASSIQFVKDGLVDLVRGEGGVEEFVKKKQFAEPQKGIKKIAHATLWKKNLQSKTSNFVIVQSILFE